MRTLRQSVLFIMAAMVVAISPNCTYSGNTTIPIGAQSLEYKIVEWKDISHALKQRGTARVVMEVSDLPSEQQMQSIARAVQRRRQATWEEITTFLYLPGMDTASLAYGIAEFHNGVMTSFSTNESSLVFTDWYERTPAAKERQKQEEAHQRRSAAGAIPSYTIDISCAEDSEGLVTVECRTNLPDGTLVSITIGRKYWMRGFDAGDEPYAADYFGDEVAVRQGRASVTTPLDDQAWVDEVQEQAARVRTFGGELYIERISESIFARALYTSNNHRHPENVLAILGPNGEFVGGPLTRPAGNGRALSVETSMHRPLRR